MKPVLLNGKDASIDYDFFVGLGADRNNIIFTPDMPKGLHEVGFKLNGNYYSARWSDKQNVLRITCEGLNYSEYTFADQRLYELSKSIGKEVFGDFIIRKIVAWPEGSKPELMIVFYEQ